MLLKLLVVNGNCNSLPIKSKPMSIWRVKKNLYPITQQMLTKQLRELEKDGLISKQVFNVISPKVECSLTQFGLSLKPVMGSLCKWVSENKKHI